MPPASSVSLWTLFKPHDQAELSAGVQGHFIQRRRLGPISMTSVISPLIESLSDTHRKAPIVIQVSKTIRTTHITTCIN